MHRNERFSKDYQDKIKALLEVIMPYLMNKYREMPVETHELNKSLAQFLKVRIVIWYIIYDTQVSHIFLSLYWFRFRSQRCLTFMDRGFVFSLINSYLDNFSPGDQRTLHDFKFTFLQIICSHEHYVSFNLPIMQSRVASRGKFSSIVGEK